MAIAAKDNPAGADSASAPPKPGLLQNTKMLIGIVVTVLMIGEGAVLYLVLAPANAPATPTDDGAAPAETQVRTVNNQSEVEIGSFNCTNNMAAPGSILHINFRLFVTIPNSDKIDFEEAESQHEHRLKEAVLVVLRKSTLEDLNDPELSTIKRRIQEAINKVVNKSYVKDVVISEFRTLEQ